MKYVVYYRVSTKRQGLSGLGLEAQRTIVENYVKSSTVIAEYTEIETGKSSNRPELNKAFRKVKMKINTFLKKIINTKKTHERKD